MKELFFVPFPLPEESPTSLLKRFAVKHGCVIPAQFSGLGAPLYSSQALSITGEVPVWIAKRAGVYDDAFLSGFYPPETASCLNKRHIIHGLTIKDSMIRWSGRGFCSECWQGGMEYFIKDFRICLHCPYHERTYLFSCPKCNIQLSWFDTLTTQCRACKSEIISPLCKQSEAVPERTLLTWFRESKQDNLDLLAHTLHSLNYTTPNLGIDSNRAKLIAAIAVVEDDQNTLIHYLHKLHSQYPQLERRIISSALSLVETETSINAVSAFLNCTCSHCSPPSFSPTTHLNPQKESFLLTRKQIRKLINLPWKQWLEFTKLTQHIWKSVGRERKIPENLILELLEDFEKFKLRPVANKPESRVINLTAAAQVLGFTPHTVRRLIKAGLLEITVKSDHSHNISEHELQKFHDTYESLNQLTSRAKQSIKIVSLAMRILNILPIPKKPFTFPVIIKRSDSDRIIEFLEAAQQRKTPNISNRKKLEFINESEIDDYYTCAEASRFSKFTPSTLACLIRNGCIIPRKLAKRRGNALYLRKSDIDAANYNFLTAGEFTKMIGTVPNLATKLLTSLGINPVAGPITGFGTTSIFRRQDIEELIYKNSNTTEETMTILEASSYLNFSVDTVMALLKTHDLSADSDGAPSALFISKLKAKNFFVTHVNAITISRWCGIHPTKIQRFLEQKNIYPTHEKPGKPTETIYRFDDLKPVGFNFETAKTNKTYLDDLILTSDLCEKLKISIKGFHKNFTKTGFVTAIYGLGKEWINQEDYKKLRSFLKNYCTLAMADSRVGITGYFKYLVDKGGIAIVGDLPPELAGKKFITNRAVALQIKHLSPSRRIIDGRT
ncbi:helix-turn-helix domain-containing protein [Pseudomonas vranovensis]|uniref:helix-turn-helix domain-containing protein n=1 Tax=Pseudomonas vranovensis TaxID=321661 RepID=UPI0003F71F91|nr:helix-turn-helix domain-containing protein [Pseudomonas vranovensis]